MAGGGDAGGENVGGTTKRLTIAFIGAKSVGKTSIIRVSLPPSSYCYWHSCETRGHCANMWRISRGFKRNLAKSSPSNEWIAQRNFSMKLYIINCRREKYLRRWPSGPDATNPSNLWRQLFIAGSGRRRGSLFLLPQRWWIETPAPTSISAHTPASEIGALIEKW